MIVIPNTTNINRIADWVELFVITENKSISKAKIQSLFEESGNDIESKIDPVMVELNRRIDLYGENTPIQLKGMSIYPEIKWTENPFYTLCLIFSTYGVQDTTDGGTILFEKIGNLFLQEFLNSQTVHLGFPITTNLRAQLDHVSTLSFEPRGALTPDPKEKDSGVDVISWSSFNDSRSGQVIVLAQCGAGYDWNDKSAISLPTWNHYINWNYETTIPSMVITQIVQADKWIKYTNKYGVLIDRARLFRIYSAYQMNIPKTFTKEVSTWCRSKLS